MRVGKNSGPVLSRLWAKVHEFFRQRRRRFLLSNAFARLSMSRFIQQLFAIKSRSLRITEQMSNFFGPEFFRKRRPQLLFGRLLAQTTVSSTVWQSLVESRLLISVCEACMQWHGNEVECRIYGGWVKTHFQLEAVCGSKLMSFWYDVADSL